MKLTSMLAVIMVICLGLGIQTSTAQGPDLGALNIAAIKSIQINADESGYYSEVMVLLENSNLRLILNKRDKNRLSINFKGADLSLIINELRSEGIEFHEGTGKVDSINNNLEDPDGYFISFDS